MFSTFPSFKFQVLTSDGDNSGRNATQVKRGPLKSEREPATGKGGCALTAILEPCGNKK